MLHWLPVQQRVEYKVTLLTFKICNTSTPAYLRRLIQDQQHGHNHQEVTPCAIGHHDAVSTVYDDDICKTHLQNPMLSPGCLELATENCSQ